MSDILTEDSDNVTISRKEYEGLLKSNRTLNALEGAGVDNWEWYGEIDWEAVHA